MIVRRFKVGDAAEVFRFASRCSRMKKVYHNIVIFPTGACASLRSIRLPIALHPAGPLAACRVFCCFPSIVLYLYIFCILFKICFHDKIKIYSLHKNKDLQGFSRAFSCMNCTIYKGYTRRKSEFFSCFLCRFIV